MRSKGKLRQLFLMLAVPLGLIAASFVGLFALQLWLVPVEITGDLGVFDGLLHGVLFPVNGVRWFLMSVPVKDFSSGWGYELGFAVGGITSVSTWQTWLHVNTHRIMGTPTPLDRPFLLGSLVFVALWLGIGMLGSGLVTPPSSDVPSLFLLMPGWLRHAGMALFGPVILVSSLLAPLGIGTQKRG